MRSVGHDAGFLDDDHSLALLRQSCSLEGKHEQDLQSSLFGSTMELFSKNAQNCIAQGSREAVVAARREVPLAPVLSQPWHCCSRG